ncbi:NHLP leader peptide family natural product precursor, partial [Francisella tularensis subsp. holarctica]|nr:NHLP leader peptide family natural product precursor [Francisella tularensis subsp. holarctica]
MDKNDFEYLLTKRAWEDKEFVDLLTSNPNQALAQLGVSIPENIKLKVVQQKK